MPGALAREDGAKDRSNKGRKVAGAAGDGEGKDGGGVALSTLDVDARAALRAADTGCDAGGCQGRFLRWYTPHHSALWRW
jgi:hypothetical protein